MTPQWMTRPSCPGTWVCVAEPGSPVNYPTVLDIDDAKLKRGVPFRTIRVYGPIPEYVEGQPPSPKIDTTNLPF